MINLGFYSDRTSAFSLFLMVLFVLSQTTCGSLPLPLSLSLFLSHSLSFCLTITHTHTFSLLHLHTHSYSNTHTHTYTHTIMNSLSLTPLAHIHAHRCIHTHTLSHSFCSERPATVNYFYPICDLGGEKKEALLLHMSSLFVSSFLSLPLFFTFLWISFVISLFYIRYLISCSLSFNTQTRTVSHLFSFVYLYVSLPVSFYPFHFF